MSSVFASVSWDFKDERFLHIFLFSTLVLSSVLFFIWLLCWLVHQKYYLLFMQTFIKNCMYFFFVWLGCRTFPLSVRPYVVGRKLLTYQNPSTGSILNLDWMHLYPLEHDGTSLWHEMQVQMSLPNQHVIHHIHLMMFRWLHRHRLVESGHFVTFRWFVLICDLLGSVRGGWEERKIDRWEERVQNRWSQSAVKSLTSATVYVTTIC